MEVSESQRNLRIKSNAVTVLNVKSLFCAALLATFGIMVVTLFIPYFKLLPAPYPMNSFFVPLLKILPSVAI